MEQPSNQTHEKAEAKKLSYLIVFLSLFVVVIFGLVPLVK
jgi:hypothetical protein